MRILKSSKCNIINNAKYKKVKRYKILNIKYIVTSNSKEANNLKNILVNYKIIRKHLIEIKHYLLKEMLISHVGKWPISKQNI